MRCLIDAVFSIFRVKQNNTSHLPSSGQVSYLGGFVHHGDGKLDILPNGELVGHVHLKAHVFGETLQDLLGLTDVRTGLSDSNTLQLSA